MLVRELRERLQKAPDDAVVVLYNGYDEGDTFCTTTAAIKCKEYDAYCQDCTFTLDLPDNTDLFVLAGFGYTYENVPAVTDNDLYLVTNNEELRKESLEKHEQQEAKEKAQREAEQKEFEESRKRRYCLNFISGGLREANYETIEEVRLNIQNLCLQKYVIFDRAGNKVVEAKE